MHSSVIIICKKNKVKNEIEQKFGHLINKLVTLCLHKCKKNIYIYILSNLRSSQLAFFILPSYQPRLYPLPKTYIPRTNCKLFK